MSIVRVLALVLCCAAVGALASWYTVRAQTKDGKRATVATISGADFGAPDGSDLSIQRAKVEGHDVWVALGYQKAGLAHHPECSLCSHSGE